MSREIQTGNRNLTQPFRSRRNVAMALQPLAWIARHSGDPIAAASMTRDSLTIFQESGMPLGSSRAIEHTVCLIAPSSPERAIRLAGAIRARPVDPSIVHWVSTWMAEFEDVVADARTRLGEEGFAAAWKEGAAMSFEEAVDHAMEALNLFLAEQNGETKD